VRNQSGKKASGNSAPEERFWIAARPILMPYMPIVQEAVIETQ
jgi:hypothetical protein